MTDFIEVTSISGKKWLIRISEIAYITKRVDATEAELKKINITQELSDFTIISLIHNNKELWVRDSYEQVTEKLEKLI